MKILVSRRSVTTTLTVSCIIVILLNLLISYLYFGGFLQAEWGLKLFKKFYVDLEQNIPSFYNTMLLLISSLLLLYIFILKKNLLKNYHPWLTLFLVFSFLSIDENTSVHEAFITILPKYFGVGGDGYLTFAWVIPYGGFVILFVIYFFNFLLTLNKKIALGFVVSGFVYVLGAIGFEMLGAKFVSMQGVENFTYALFATIEETLEMSGIILFINFLLAYIEIEFNAVEVRVNA